jgi:hypothetical protein
VWEFDQELLLVQFPVEHSLHWECWVVAMLTGPWEAGQLHQVALVVKGVRLRRRSLVELDRFAWMATMVVREEVERA